MSKRYLVVRSRGRNLNRVSKINDVFTYLTRQFSSLITSKTHTGVHVCRADIESNTGLMLFY